MLVTLCMCVGSHGRGIFSLLEIKGSLPRLTTQGAGKKVVSFVHTFLERALSHCMPRAIHFF